MSSLFGLNEFNGNYKYYCGLRRVHSCLCNTPHVYADVNTCTNPSTCINIRERRMCTLQHFDGGDDDENDENKDKPPPVWYTFITAMFVCRYFVVLLGFLPQSSRKTSEETSHTKHNRLHKWMVEDQTWFDSAESWELNVDESWFPLSFNSLIFYCSGKAPKEIWKAMLVKGEEEQDTLMKYIATETEPACQDFVLTVNKKGTSLLPMRTTPITKARC